jgi:hypothetical protein
METDPALARTAGVVVLTAEAAENTDAPVIYADRDAEMVFPERLPQKIPGRLVELEKVGHGVELFLGHLERVETFNSHISASSRSSIYDSVPEVTAGTKPLKKMISDAGSNSKRERISGMR